MTDHDHVLEPDREDKLRRIREIKTILVPALEKEYEELRDEVVPEVLEEGFVYLIGPDGTKYKATVTQQHTTKFDIPTLKRMLPAATFKLITEPRVNREKWDEAVDSNLIPDEVQIKAVSFVPKKPFVYFDAASNKHKTS